MVRRGPPPKGHKARARTGKTVGGGKVTRQGKTPRPPAAAAA